MQDDGMASSSNAAMVEELVQSGSLRHPEAVAAFKAVDRGDFWVEQGSIAYADMPLRHGKFHQSAPHIYARALEALFPLKPGMSFLNIGSGTGYFSSLVHHLTGDVSVNDGIDIWQESVTHAQERCKKLGKKGLEFSLGNVYQLDVNLCMRYDRIYIGACATQQARYLYELLELGGVLVAPFQVGHSQQQLQRVTRQTESHFKVEVLNSVHFACLVEPPRSSNEALPVDISAMNDVLSEQQPARGGAEAVVGLPGVPFTFALRQVPWSLARAWAYPEAFRKVVDTVMIGRVQDYRELCLPMELWVEHILPWCPRWWFEPQAASSSGFGLPVFLSAFASAGGSVRRALMKRARLMAGRGSTSGSVPRALGDAGREGEHAAEEGEADLEADEDLEEPEREEEGEEDGEEVIGFDLAEDSEEEIPPRAAQRPGRFRALLEVDGGHDGQDPLPPEWDAGARGFLYRPARCLWRCLGRCCQGPLSVGSFQKLKHFAMHFFTSAYRSTSDGSEEEFYAGYRPLITPSL